MNAYQALSVVRIARTANGLLQLDKKQEGLNKNLAIARIQSDIEIKKMEIADCE